MTGHVGLRERQRLRTQQAIQDAATRLFLAADFQSVGVDAIAAAAEVSKRTLFKYFASKEDLVIGAFADHADEPARIVFDRPPGRSPLAALQAYFLDGLARRDPVTGLDDRPQTLAFVHMVLSVPPLQARLLLYQVAAERALEAALKTARPVPPDDLAHLAACQVFALLRALAEDNRSFLVAGATAEERYPGAVEAAIRGFTLLSGGLAEYYDT